MLISGGPMTSSLPPDSIELSVAPGSTVLVISDLHLRASTDAATSRVDTVLAARLDQLVAPAVAVLAGDIVELLGEPGMRPRDAFAAHPRLTQAIRRIADLEGGTVVELIGNHDGDLAWDADAAAEVRTAIGARLALTADLLVQTPQGCRRIRVEHGNRFDPYNCFRDVRNPLDTPLGHHVVREVLPIVNQVGPGWLDGAMDLADPPDFPSFVGSRLAYRRLAGHLRWLVIPLVLMLFLLRMPLVLLVTNHVPEDVRDWLRRSALLGGAVIVDVLVVVFLVAVLIRRTWQALRTLDLSDRGWGQNNAAREEAEKLASDGYAGLICGHSHRPEVGGLSRYGAFFANSGSGTPVVEAVPARFGMPPVYLRYLQVSWIQLQCQAGLTVELQIAQFALPGATKLERLLAKRRHERHPEPVSVGCWPGAAWPAGD
jgi:UDP-2,3-diacylglucosamine pyrophosphatase LpxH